MGGAVNFQLVGTNRSLNDKVAEGDHTGNRSLDCANGWRDHYVVKVAIGINFVGLDTDAPGTGGDSVAVGVGELKNWSNRNFLTRNDLGAT